MLRYCKLVNWGILIVLMGILGTNILTRELFAGKTAFLNPDRFSALEDYSSELEKQIRAGVTTTADLIVDYHPRMWLRGYWDWDNKDSVGTLAWRIEHGASQDRSDPANDQETYEFNSVFQLADGDGFAAERGYYSLKYLWTIVAAEASARLSDWNLPENLPDRSRTPAYIGPIHTEDEFLEDAVNKLLYYLDSNDFMRHEYPYYIVIDGSVAYDWLVKRKFSDGITPVLSEEKRTCIQNGLIRNAEYIRNKVNGSELLFDTAGIANYIYVMVGLALYEPSGQGISTENNAKAKQYLDEFDEYWIGRILPAINEQGGTGGWHAGLCKASSYFDCYVEDQVLTYSIARILFAHYTATGQPIENSLYSTGAVKYAIEFQNHMVYPDGDYVTIGVNMADHRYKWITPLYVTARRRFSSDPEQQWLGELAGWFRNEIAPNDYVDGGSWCMFDQLMWEEKWPNPWDPLKLECRYGRHFAKLGWVCMRSGFTSPDDLAGLFICQRYHWSELDPYAQNSFTLERKGKLIEGYQNTIWLDDQYQRTISGFPTMADGVETYAPGSKYDVGPGILDFANAYACVYMIGDATNAYDSNKLEKFTRGLVWINKNNVFVMFDNVVTKDAGIKKSWVIDPGSVPHAEEKNLVKITNGAGALWIKRFLPEKVKETMNDSKFEVVPDQPARENYFLHVMQTVDANHSKNSPQVVADDAELINQSDQIGVRIDDLEILFSKSNSSIIWINGVSNQRTELESFAAMVNDKVIELTWRTLSEYENIGFEVELSSRNGFFSKIGFVKGLGTSKVPQSYQFLDNTVKEGKYYYRLKQLNSDGTFQYSYIVEITVGHTPTDKITVKHPDLFNNYPNPFNASTEISYNLPATVDVELSVFNIYGRHIKTLVQERQSEGLRIVKWDGNDKNGFSVASGMYFYQLKAGEFSINKKMLLVR